MKEWTKGKMEIRENEDPVYMLLDIIVDGDYIGTVYIEDEESRKDAVAQLDEDPESILSWDDGCGNPISLDRDSDFYTFHHSQQYYKDNYAD